MIDNLLTLADLDRIIHQSSRTRIVAILHYLESADFLYLRRETGLTQGNLSTHLVKLEKAGYI
jgi:DNA-binding MarR family transcriptional regulator